MSTQVLEPTEEFKQAVSQALASQSLAGKIAAIREVFNTWLGGDPLALQTDGYQTGFEVLQP
ncbi:hypothetical protein FRC07_002200 [Ceratobasidium sp. 392]|nr:hypothetical protein FRC07_002200 [Ceratobasidium sp. 392]